MHMPCLCCCAGSVTVGFGPGGSSLLVDPDELEEKACEALISLTFPYHFDLTASTTATPAAASATPTATAAAPQLVMGDGLLTSHTWGRMSSDMYLDAYEVCRLGVGQVAEFTRGYLNKERLLTA